MRRSRGIFGLLMLTVASSLPAYAFAQNRDLCVGRHYLRAPADSVIESTTFQFYWGELTVTRESREAFLKRAAKIKGQSDGTATLGTSGESFLISRPILLEEPTIIDPNSSTVIAAAHRAGVTVEYEKRTVNRLLSVATARAKEIIESVVPVKSNEVPPVEHFCAGDVLITLTPRAGWFESAVVRGRFTTRNEQFKFLFTANSLRNSKFWHEDYTAQREEWKNRTSVRWLNTDKGEPLKTSKKEKAPLKSATRLYWAEDENEKVFPVYEWLDAFDRKNGIAAYLYVWPVKREEPTEELLRRDISGMAAEYARFIDVRARRSAVVNKREASFQKEESKVPYTYIVRKQTGEPIVGAPYELLRNSVSIFKGKTGQNGVTVAQNMDFYEDWSLVVDDTHLK